MGPLAALDVRVQDLSAPDRSWLPWLHAVLQLGERTVVLPILGAVALLVSRRRRSWRPAIVAASAYVLLNAVLLSLKVGLGRERPDTGDPGFFNGGMSYPSGHNANVVLAYGLSVYLLSRYGFVQRRHAVALYALVAAGAAAMVVTSLMLQRHWLADPFAGLLVGAIVLRAAMTVDRALPAEVVPSAAGRSHNT